MSIVPRDFFSDDGDQALSNIWDRLLARHNEFFSNSPFSSAFPFQFPFPSPFSSSRTVPYSELSIESQGSVATRLECREIEEALVFVADIPSGVEKDDVSVEVGEEQGSGGGGGALRISGGGGAGRFSWKFRLPPTAKLHLMNYSVENGVLTVIVPKVVAWEEAVAPPRSRDVRVVEIEGDD